MAADTVVDRWKIEQYLSNVFLLASQKESRLSPYVTVKSGLNGEKVFLDDIFDPDAVMDVRERTGRAEPTPAGSGSYERRAMYYRFMDWYSQPQDSIDKFLMIHDIDSIHREAGSRKIGQRRDQIILGTTPAGAVNTDRSGGFFGNAYSGKDGLTTVSLPTTAYSAAATPDLAWVIDVDLGGTTTSITFDKLLKAKEILMAREVFMPGDTIVCPLTARLKTDLKRDLELIHRDWVSAAQVGWEGGEIMSYPPFVFPHYEALPKNGSSQYRVPLWIPRYMCLGIWGSVSGDVIQRPDLSNSYQLFFEYAEDAVRVHEEGVLEMICA